MAAQLKGRRPEAKRSDAIAQEVSGEPAIGDMESFVKRIKPEVYLRTYIAEKKTRIDGREMHAWRNFEVQCGLYKQNPYIVGTAQVSNGATQACATVELQIGMENDPRLEFEVRPGTSGRDLGWARQTELLIAEVFAEPEKIPEQLKLKVTIICFSDQGALIDACILAATAALVDTRMPQISFDDTLNLLSVKTEAIAHPLELPILPIALTCAIFDAGHGRIILTDPTHFEEALCTLVTVVLGALPTSFSNANTTPHTVLKLRHFPGGRFATTPALLRDCLRLASRRISAFEIPAAWSARLNKTESHSQSLLGGTSTKDTLHPPASH